MNDFLDWLLQLLATYKEAIEALAAIATTVSIVVLVWDRLHERPDFEMSRLAPLPFMTGELRFRIENRGRQEAPAAYVEYSIRRLRDGIRISEKKRIEVLVPARDNTGHYRWVPEYDLKAGGYTEVSLIPEYFEEAKYLDGFLIFDIYAVKASGRFVFLFRRRNESIRIWSGILVYLLYWVCLCVWLLLSIKTSLVKMMRRMKK